MAIFGGTSKSDQRTTVTTTQTDRRIGASEGSLVAAEGSTVTVTAADADLVGAALAGSRANLREALEFSSRAAERDRALVESALTQAAGEAPALRSGLLLAVGAAGVVALLAVWRR